MDERRQVRASDRDRQEAVDRLRVAMDEGRLSLFEYDARLAKAYQSVTYGDIADLFVDLPKAGTVAKPQATVTPAIAKQAARGFIAGLPGGLKVVWSVWVSILVIIFASWIMVDISNAGREDFWPMWMAIPTAVLFAISMGVNSAHRARIAKRAAEIADRSQT